MRAAPARQRHLRLGGPTWTALVAAMAAALCNVTAASAEPPAAAGREALARALDWLQTNQGPRGDWNTSSPATASLAALASLAAGHLPARGSRGQIAQGAIEFLTHQIAAGSLGSEAARPDARLDHALAILALTQAYGTCDDARIGQTLDVAVRRLQRNLRADAAAGTSHSIHVLAWHALALESAAQCGLVVTQDAWDALWQLAAACPTPPLDGDAAPPTHAGMPPPPPEHVLAETVGWIVVWQALAPQEPRRPRAVASLHALLETLPSAATPAASPVQPELEIDPIVLALLGLALLREGDERCQAHLSSLQQWLARSQRRLPEDPLVHGAWQTATAPGKPSAAATAASALLLALPDRTLPAVP